jgi:hypothetical protein
MDQFIRATAACRVQWRQFVVSHPVQFGATSQQQFGGPAELCERLLGTYDACCSFGSRHQVVHVANAPIGMKLESPGCLEDLWEFWQWQYKS